MAIASILGSDANSSAVVIPPLRAIYRAIYKVAERLTEIKSFPNTLPLPGFCFKVESAVPARPRIEGARWSAAGRRPARRRSGCRLTQASFPAARPGLVHLPPAETVQLTLDVGANSMQQVEVRHRLRAVLATDHIKCLARARLLPHLLLV